MRLISTALFICVCVLACIPQANIANAAPPDAIVFSNMPDTVSAFTVLQQKFYFKIGSDTLRWFEIHWRSEDGSDLLVNAGYYTSDDSITLSYNVPSANAKKCYFWAWCSHDRSWATQVWSGESKHAVIRAVLRTYDWVITPSKAFVAVGDSLSIAVSVSWNPSQGEIFPYLFCDLGSDADLHLYARAIGYDVQAGQTSFVFPFHILRRAAGRTLKVRCYLTDGFDPNGPVLSETSTNISVGPLTVQDTSRQQLQLADFSWSVGGKRLFLNGVDLTSNWVSWGSATLELEVSKMASHNLNYIRLWWDWSAYEPSPGVFSSAIKAKIAHMLRVTEAHGIYVELVPVGNWGGWVFDMYRDHWWTDSVNQAAQYRYFNEVAKFVLSTGARNIAYISLMQEGGSGFDWFDPKLTPSGWQSYPGLLDSLEALADWKNWLRINSRPSNWTYDSSVTEFGRFASEKFNDLITLRRKAVEDAAGSEFRVGLEGGQGGFQYDRNILGFAPGYYLKAERWCHLVDVAEIHNYVPNGFAGYWDYAVGIKTYDSVVHQFGVPANIGEYQYTWAGHGAGNVNNDSMPYAWNELRKKLDTMRLCGVLGCAIWNWMDYDDRKLGLEDTGLHPRPILDSLAQWASSWNLSVALNGNAFHSTLALSPNPAAPGENTVINGADDGTPVCVSDLLGRKLTCRSTSFTAPATPGVYIVRVGETALKLLVR